MCWLDFWTKTYVEKKTCLKMSLRQFQALSDNRIVVQILPSVKINGFFLRRCFDLSIVCIAKFWLSWQWTSLPTEWLPLRITNHAFTLCVLYCMYSPYPLHFTTYEASRDCFKTGFCLQRNETNRFACLPIHDTRDR